MIEAAGGMALNLALESASGGRSERTAQPAPSTAELGLEAAVLKLAARNPDGLDPAAVAMKLGVPLDEVFDLLDRLLAEGKIVREE